MNIDMNIRLPECCVNMRTARTHRSKGSPLVSNDKAANEQTLLYTVSGRVVFLFTEPVRGLPLKGHFCIFLPELFVENFLYGKSGYHFAENCIEYIYIVSVYCLV